MISGVVVRVRGGRFGTVTMKSSVAVWFRQTSVTDTEKVCVLLGETVICSVDSFVFHSIVYGSTPPTISAVKTTGSPGQRMLAPVISTSTGSTSSM